MANQSTTIHMFLALSTQWMSSVSRKWGSVVRLWFHLVVFVLGVIQENWGAGESEIPNTNGGELLHRPSNSYRKLLDRVAFRILSNINGEAPQWKDVECLYVTGLMMAMLMVFFTCDKLGLVLCGVGPILRNGCGYWGKNYVALFQGSEMSAG